MPTRPSDQGRRTAHATVSSPSPASCTEGSKTPSEPNRPRQSCSTTANPAPATVTGFEPGRVEGEVAAVGGAGEDHRKRLPVGVRPVDRRPEDGPVPHRDLDVGFYEHAVERHGGALRAAGGGRGGGGGAGAAPPPGGRRLRRAARARRPRPPRGAPGWFP